MELLLRLRGAIDRSIPESVRRAAAEASELQRRMERLRGIEANARRFQAMEQAGRTLSEQLARARSEAARLGTVFQQNQATVAQYRAQLDQARAALSGMNRNADPGAYRAQREEIARLRDAHRAAQAAARASGREYRQAARSARDAGAAYSENQAGLLRLSTELRDAGFYTQSFASSQNHLQRELQQTGQALEQARRAQEQHNAQQQRRRQGQEAHSRAQQSFYNATGNWQTGLEMSRKLLAPLADAVSTAMEFESAMADVRKVVDFDTPKQFEEMQQDILSLSGVLPMAAEDIAKIVAAGGQSGIAREDLMGFAESAVKMGIAFDVTADQAGEMMAKWRTAFAMGQEQVVELADKVNYLGNTTAASAPLISDVISRVGPLGAVGGVASGEIAALGASMIGVGVPSDVAATGIKNLILSMVAGEGATKSQAAAFQSLGMDAAEMAKRMQTDARGAILDVFTAIQSLDADKQASTLQALFGKESLGAIAPLLANLGNLRDNFGKVADAASYAGSMEAEYAARSQTTENQVQLAKNALAAAAKTVGSQFLPMAGKAAGMVASGARALAGWASEHKEIVVAAGAAAAAIAGLVMSVLSVNAAVSGWKLLVATVRTVGPAVSGALSAIPGMLSGAFAGIAAMGWPVVLAILAIVAVVALVAANFDKLKETATVVFNHISGTVGAWAATIQAKFAEALNKITEVWNSVTGQSLQSSELIGAIFNNLGFVLGAAFDVAAGIVGTAISVIMNQVVSVAQIIGGVINIVAGLLTGDWDRVWKGAGQAVEGFAGGTLGTLKTIAGGIGDVFDTLMGKADEVQKKAEQAKASQDVTASSRNALPQATADYLPNEGMLQTAQAAQQTAAATAEASANAQALSANVQQGGAAAQQTAGYMQQLQELMGQIPGTSQAAFAGMGEQSAVAAQSVSMNMQQIPQQAQAALQQIQPQAQAAFQQLPPHAQQGVDGIAQEVSQLAVKCQPGWDAFVQAANQWGQQAYESIANWSSQMAQVVVDRLSSAWAQISSQFSAGLNVNVTTSGAGVAANAEGGIYRKGAFLTTFAEKSPEAAIPLDGSTRAISLWQRAGELLGMLPKGTGNAASFDAPVLPDIQQVTAGLKDAHTTTLPPPVVETAQQAAPAVQAAVPAAAILPPAARPETILRREAPPPMGGVFQAIRESASQAVSGLAQKGSLFLERLLPAQQAMGAEFPMAGALLPSLGDVAELAMPQENDWRADAPITMEPPSGGGMHMHFEYHAPSITIQGNADSETASQIERVLAEARSEWMREVERRFGGMLASHIHQQRRTSYAT